MQEAEKAPPKPLMEIEMSSNQADVSEHFEAPPKEVHNEPPSTQKDSFGFEQPSVQQETFEQPPVQKEAFEEPPAAQQEVFEQPPIQKETFEEPQAAHQEVFDQPPAHQEVFDQPPVEREAFEEPPAQREVFEQPPVQQEVFEPPVQQEVFEPPVQQEIFEPPVVPQQEVYEQPPPVQNEVFEPPAHHEVAEPQPQSEVFEPTTFEPPQSEPLPVMEKVTMASQEPQSMPNNGNHQVEDHGNHPEPQEPPNLGAAPHETQSQDQNETPIAVPVSAEPEPGMPF